MLIQSLRHRGVSAEAVITGKELEQQQRSVVPTETDAGAVLMPFGKYAGLPLRKIDPKYLRWILWKCSKAAICATIRAYLKLPQK